MQFSTASYSCRATDTLLPTLGLTVVAALVEVGLPSPGASEWRASTSGNPGLRLHIRPHCQGRIPVRGGVPRVRSTIHPTRKGDRRPRWQKELSPYV